MAKTSLYATQVKPYLKDIEEMAKNGITQAEIAKTLKINLRTFARYIKSEAELREALSAGRQVAIKELENALYKSALGSKEKLKKGMKVKKVMYENGRKKAEIESVEMYDEEIFVKPDTTAAIFLLKNWNKKEYVSDPALYDLKVRELELKERKADGEITDDNDPFCS